MATWDTGVNPFHPCWREGAPRTPAEALLDLPSEAAPLNLTFADTYEASLKASRAALEAIEPDRLYYVPGTRLLFASMFGGQLLDDADHGGKASTQIACPDYAFGSDAFVLALDTGQDVTQQAELTLWLAGLPWVDVVHFNFQDIPVLAGALFPNDEAMAALVASGKLVVLPAGNGIANAWVAFPTEVSRFTGPPGSLVVGACDGTGWTVFSNYDPHVCPDGSGTLAGASAGDGSDSFDGTSSSSPRAAGYAAELLRGVRQAYSVREGMVGEALVRLPADGKPWPETGPLADGNLTAAELHEAIRRTADAALPADSLDGDTTSFWMPAAQAPYARYLKQGYGKLTHATMDDALAVLLGNEGLPERPEEDAMYEASEALRRAYWDDVF